MACSSRWSYYHKTLEVMGVSVIINTDGAYSETESVWPIVAIPAKFDKVHSRCPYKYECDSGFVLSMIEEVVFANLSRVVKDIGRVCILMRFVVMVKFKYGLYFEDVGGI